MKKVMMVMTAFFMLPFGVMAETPCSNNPTCTNLGYIYSAAQCGSYKKVQCPFDESKYFCTHCNNSGAFDVCPDYAVCSLTITEYGNCAYFSECDESKGYYSIGTLPEYIESVVVSESECAYVKGCGSAYNKCPTGAACNKDSFGCHRIDGCDEVHGWYDGNDDSFIDDEYVNLSAFEFRQARSYVIGGDIVKCVKVDSAEGCAEDYRSDCEDDGEGKVLEDSWTIDDLTCGYGCVCQYVREGECEADHGACHETGDGCWVQGEEEEEAFCDESEGYYDKCPDGWICDEEEIDGRICKTFKRCNMFAPENGDGECEWHDCYDFYACYISGDGDRAVLSEDDCRKRGGNPRGSFSNEVGEPICDGEGDEEMCCQYESDDGGGGDDNQEDEACAMYIEICMAECDSESDDDNDCMRDCMENNGAPWDCY